MQPCTCYKPEQQQQRHSVGWRGTVGLRGRRKYVLVGLVAASMRLTPRKPTLPRLRQVGNGGCRHAGLLVGVDLGRHGASAASDPLLLFFFLFRGWTRARNCQKRGKRGFGRACCPAPAEATATATAAFGGMAGYCGFAGTPQVRPCRLGRRIHAAHTPQTHSTPPSTVFRGCW